MAATAGSVGADQEGGEKAVDGRKVVAPGVEGCRGSDLGRLE